MFGLATCFGTEFTEDTEGTEEIKKAQIARMIFSALCVLRHLVDRVCGGPNSEEIDDQTESRGCLNSIDRRN